MQFLGNKSVGFLGSTPSGIGYKICLPLYYTMLDPVKKPVKKPRRWTQKYKKSINCKRPKGFSQKQYCRYSRKQIY